MTLDQSVLDQQQAVLNSIAAQVAQMKQKTEPTVVVVETQTAESEEPGPLTENEAIHVVQSWIAQDAEYELPERRTFEEMTETLQDAADVRGSEISTSAFKDIVAKYAPDAPHRLDAPSKGKDAVPPYPPELRPLVESGFARFEDGYWLVKRCTKCGQYKNECCGRTELVSAVRQGEKELTSFGRQAVGLDPIVPPKSPKSLEQIAEAPQRLVGFEQVLDRRMRNGQRRMPQAQVEAGEELGGGGGGDDPNQRPQCEASDSTLRHASPGWVGNSKVVNSPCPLCQSPQIKVFGLQCHCAPPQLRSHRRLPTGAHLATAPRVQKQAADRCGQFPRLAIGHNTAVARAHEGSDSDFRGDDDRAPHRHRFGDHVTKVLRVGWQHEQLGILVQRPLVSVAHRPEKFHALRQPQRPCELFQLRSIILIVIACDQQWKIGYPLPRRDQPVQSLLPTYTAEE